MMFGMYAVHAPRLAMVGAQMIVNSARGSALTTGRALLAHQLRRSDSGIRDDALHGICHVHAMAAECAVQRIAEVLKHESCTGTSPENGK